MTTTQNHIDEAILVAKGEMLKKDYADILGIDPTRISKVLPEKYEIAINRIEAEKEELKGQNKELKDRIKLTQDLASELQAEIKENQETIKNLQGLSSEWKLSASESQTLANRSQAEIKELQAENEQMKAHIKELQAIASNLQSRESQFQKDARILQADRDELKARLHNLQDYTESLKVILNRYEGQPPVIRTLASVDARAVMLFLLAAFEGVGSFHLLLHKGFWLALPVSIALAFALLVFTASNNRPGKWFVIAFALAVGGIYFDVFPANWANYLFAFVPPVVAALIAVSLKPSRS